jgi:acetyltransferase-like isoleucine patch superfamily enzyme
MKKSKNPIRIIRHRFAKVISNCYKTYLRLAGIKIGKGGMISLYAHIDVRRGKVIIGDNVIITSGCYILSHSAVEKKLHRNRPQRNITIIEDNVFIGVNSVILPGVKIEKNSIIGAGSVVTKDVKCNSVYSGNPAKLKKKINEIGTASL